MIEWAARNSQSSILNLSKSFTYKMVFRGWGRGGGKGVCDIFVYAIFENCQGIDIYDIRTKFVLVSDTRRQE